MKIRFYACSIPPLIDFPFVLRNIKQKAHPSVIHEIVDCGIYDLLKGNNRHSEERLKKWKSIKPLGWKTVPDCPDLKGEFQTKINFDNVEYSKELLEELYNPENPTHLPFIQSKFQKINSVISFVNWFKNNYPIPKKLAIGTVCKANDKETVGKTFRIVRKHFPQTWIHAFGLKLTHLDVAINYVNSYDSASWSFPRSIGHRTMNSNIEAPGYFETYLDSFFKIAENKRIKGSSKLMKILTGARKPPICDHLLLFEYSENDRHFYFCRDCGQKITKETDLSNW